jgi:two-component system NtrC family sensor kinase
VGTERRVRQRIAVRLIVGVGLTLVVVLGGAALVGLKGLEEAAISQAIQGGDRLATTIGKSLRHSMLTGDREAVRKTVAAVGNSDVPLRIRVFNKDGRVMFASGESDIGRSVPVSDPACRGCHDGGRPAGTLDERWRGNIYRDEEGARQLQRIVPIANERECSDAPCHVHAADQRVLGVMDVAVSLADLDGRVAGFRQRAIAITGGIVALIAVIIGVLVRRIVTRRVASLVDGTRVISAGRLDHRIEAMGTDELGELATSFNAMTGRLEEARGRLLQSERLSSIGRLSAGIAHEINNPLTGVMLMAGSLLERLPPDDPRRETLQSIVNETTRCREVIKGLLDFARPRAPDKVATPIDDVLERAATLVRRQAEARRVAIDVGSGGPSPVAAIDAAQVLQVVLNLLLNAVDATPEGGGVRVARRADGANVEIDVADDGAGIAPERLSQIFEPFYTTKEAGQGTGLGLAVSWGIVEQHGGTIAVRSEQGKGSTFTVRLPAK